MSMSASGLCDPLFTNSFSHLAPVLDLVLKPHTSALIQTFLLIFKEKKPEFCQMHCRRIVGDLLTPTDE